MALYVLGDTHLSLGGSKPMDIFPGWDGYVERLERNWRKLITPQDTIVLAGDISWAMRLTDTRKETRQDGTTVTTKTLTEKLQDDAGRITTQVTKTITEAGKRLVDGVERSYKTITTYVDGVKQKTETILGADGLQRTAEEAADGLDAGALIELAVDELAVHDAAALVAEAGFTEDELALVLPLDLGKALLVRRNEDDLIHRFAVVLLDGADGHAELHHFAPALGLTVDLARRFGEEVGEPLDHLDAAVGLVPHFQRTFGPGAFQRGSQAADLFRFHGDIHQDLPIAAHIAAR